MKCESVSRTKFNAVFLPLVAVLAIVITPTLSKTEPAIDDQFTREVHAFNKVVMDGRGDWLSPPSPWIPYIDRQYWEGLPPVQKQQYLAFQTKGKCVELMKLEKIGFAGLYPELSRALSDKIVNDIFTVEIVPFRSFGGRRCRALAMLNPIIENEKKLDAEYYYLTIPGTNLGNKPGRVYDPREVILRKAFTVLFDLAACEDYKPAINDILEYRKLYLIFVGHSERYYFYTRAKHYGLKTSDISPVVSDMQQFNLSRQLQKMQYFLARGDLDAARKQVFRFTYISCGRSASE